MATEAASLFVTLSAKTDQYTKAMDSANTRLASFTGSTAAKTKAVSDSFQKTGNVVSGWGKRLHKDVDVAAKDVEKSSHRQVAANRRIQESMKGAASGLIALAAAYKAYTSAKDAVSSTVDLAEQTGKLQAITGSSAKTTSTWIETLKSLGVSTESTKTGFLNFQRQISAAESGSKTAGKAFQGLGIDMSELKKGNFQQTLLDVSDALHHMTNRAQEGQVAQLLFGRGAKGLIPLLSQGKDKVEEALKGTQKYGDYISGKGLEATRKFKEAQIDFGSAMGGLKIAFATSVIPFLLPIVKGISAFVQGMRDGKGAGGDFAAALKFVFERAKSAFEWVRKLAGKVLDLKPAVEAVVTAFLALEVGSAVLSAITALTDPIYLAFAALAAAAYLIITNWKVIKPFFEDLWKKIEAPVKKLWGAVVAGFDRMKGALVKGWGEITAAFDGGGGSGVGKVDWGKKAIDALKWIIGALTEVVTVWTTVWSALVPIEAAIFAAVITGVKAAISWIIGAWKTIGPTVIAVWDTVKQAAVDAAKWIVNAFNNAVNFLVPIFVNIWNAFKPVLSAIVNGVASLVPTILPFVNAVIGVFKFFFNLLKTVAPVAFKVVTTALAPVISIIKTVANFVIPLIGKAFQAAWAIIKVVLKAIGDIISGGFQVVKGVIEFFTGLFTLDFSKMWTGIKDIFKGAMTALVGVLKGAWNTFYDAGKFIIQGIGAGFKAAFKFVEGLLNDFLNALLAPINIVLGVLGVDKIHVNIGGGGGGGGGSGGTPATGGPGQRSGTGHATGGKVTRPGYFAGEQAPAHPEYILATNPAYRQRNLGLWAQAGGELGVPGFAAGGVPGEVQSFMSGAGFNNIAIAGMLGNAQQESTMNPNTPGGGLWQQVTNFGQGTGGSLLHQMQVMLPQIMHLQSAMNNAGSPGHAATIFELGFEIAGTPAMANRVSYAESFYAQLGGKGGKGIFSILGGIASGVAGLGVDAVKAMLPKAPNIPGFLHKMPEYLLNKSVKWIEDNLNPFSGGGGGGSAGGTQGPKGLGTFDGYQVANWIIPELNWARSHGWGGHITSGFRSEAGSEHALTQYPGGAVDVGYNTDIANGTALWNVIKNYPGKLKLLWGGQHITGYTDPRGVTAPGGHDFGHFSGTGFKTGGIPGYRTGAYAGVGHAGSGYNTGSAVPKGPAKSVHWNWQTNSYQSMTSAQYKALQSAWYGQHPTLRMPSGPPGGKSKGKGKSHKAPATSYHWDWQKKAYESMTSAEYKTLQAQWYAKHPKDRMPTSPPKAKTPTVDQLAVLVAQRKAKIPKGISKLLKSWGKKESNEPGIFQTVRNLRQTEQNYVDSFNHMDFLPTDTATLVNGVWTMEPTALSDRMNRLHYLEDTFLTPAQKTLNKERSTTPRAVKAAQDKHKSLLKLVKTIRARINKILKEIDKQRDYIIKETIAVTKAKTSKEKTQHAVNIVHAQNKIGNLMLALGTKSSTKTGTEYGDLNNLTNKDHGKVGKYANTIPALFDSMLYFSDQSKIGDPNSKTPTPVLGFLSIPDRQTTLTDLFSSVHQEMAAVSGSSTVPTNTALDDALKAQTYAAEALYNVSQAQYRTLGNVAGVTDLGPVGGSGAAQWGTFLGSFASGIANVPFDGLAAIHKGEAVIPASQNPFTNSTGSTPHVAVHLHGAASAFSDAVEVVIDGKTADIVKAANNAIGFKIGTARQTPMSPGRVARY